MPKPFFEKIRWPALWTLAVVMPVSIALTNIVFFTLAGLWILNGPSAWRARPLRWTLFEKMVAVFLLVSSLSAALGLRPSHSFFRLLNKDMNVVVLFLMMAWVRETEEARKLLTVFIAATAATAAWGCLQWFSGIRVTEIHNQLTFAVPPIFQGWSERILFYLGVVNDRAMGTRSHPLRYSECLLLGMAWLLPLFTLGWGKMVRWSFLGIVVTAGALAASQSRGSWLTAVVLLVIALLCQGRQIFSWRSLCMVLPFMLVMLSPHFQARARTIGNMQFNSNQERLHMWQVAGTLFKERPLLGVGPGNVRTATERFWTAEEAVDGGWGHLHNTFIQMLVDRGFLGCVAFMVFLGSLLWPLAKKAWGESPERAWMIGGVLAILAFAATGLTENVYGNMDVLMSFYFVMALVHRMRETAHA